MDSSVLYPEVLKGTECYWKCNQPKCYTAFLGGEITYYVLALRFLKANGIKTLVEQVNTKVNVYLNVICSGPSVRICFTFKVIRIRTYKSSVKRDRVRRFVWPARINQPTKVLSRNHLRKLTEKLNIFFVMNKTNPFLLHYTGYFQVIPICMYILFSRLGQKEKCNIGFGVRIGASFIAAHRVLLQNTHNMNMTAIWRIYLNLFN